MIDFFPILVPGKYVSKPFQRLFLPLANLIRVVLNLVAISAIVASSSSASRAIFALNSAEYLVLFILLISVRPPS